MLPPKDTNLDILRAIAVLIVVADHGFQMYNHDQFRLGRYGVLIFFVHTSLVLMMSLERMAARQPHIVRAFYIQRAFRIYPLSILTVLLVVAFRVPVGPYTAVVARPGPFMLISNLLLIQNSGVGSVSAPLWSLPYEVQMYLLLPFLFYLLYRYRGAWMMTLLLGASLIVGSFQLFSPYGKLTQFFPCFMAGIWAYWLRGRQTHVLPAALWPVGIVALASAFWLGRPFFGDQFLVCLLLGFALGYFREPRPSVLTKAAHQIAKYSYGIYLAHDPLYWLCFQKIGFHSLVTCWATFLVLLAIVPFVAFHSLEAPMIQLGKRVTALPVNIQRPVVVQGNR